MMFVLLSLLYLQNKSSMIKLSFYMKLNQSVWKSIFQYIPRLVMSYQQKLSCNPIPKVLETYNHYRLLGLLIYCDKSHTQFIPFCLSWGAVIISKYAKQKHLGCKKVWGIQK